VNRATVVIPNWNGMQHLQMCLEALRAQTFSDFETIVVDNASTDGSIDYLRNQWPEVRLIELSSNLGFPAAVNAGIRASSSEYVVLLNNDTRAEPTWLETLVRTMDDHPNFSFGSSKLLRLDTPSVIDSAGHYYSLWLGAGLNVGESDDAGRFAQRAWVFGTCAAASIYRRSLFADIGEFDEDFFFAHEDVEFDLRANVAGHRCLLVADAVVYHKRGGSHEVSSELDLMGIRNRLWLAGKNLPPLALSLWFGAKVVRIFWWLPARLLGLWNGGTDGPRPAADEARAPRLRVPDILRIAAQTGRTLPAKRRAAKPVRRISSLALLRVLRSTKSTPALDAQAR
jgi:GT2 family glycosyltransferase